MCACKTAIARIRFVGHKFSPGIPKNDIPGELLCPCFYLICKYALLLLPRACMSSHSLHFIVRTPTMAIAAINRSLAYKICNTN